MAEQLARLPDGTKICHETFGDPGDPAMLLVMGLGCPMGWWSVEFCELLVQRGFFVIRFDNRDTGRSTRFRGERVSRRQLVRAFLRRPVAVPYSMSALADDAFGLLDDLDLERAHVAGISMGGMIAQTMAIARPARIASMTSIMSTTGARRVGWQHPKLFPSLLAPAGNARESYVRRSLRSATLMRSPGYDLDTDYVIARAEETFDRGWSSSGVVRQMLAVLTQPDRTRDLQHLTMPVCVIHGLNDPMVHRSGGRATAAGIPGAQLVTIPGMGHDMPRALYVTIIDAITRTARRASVSR